MSWPGNTYLRITLTTYNGNPLPRASCWEWLGAAVKDVPALVHRSPPRQMGAGL